MIQTGRIDSYLQQLTPQARSSLLIELERLEEARTAPLDDVLDAAAAAWSAQRIAMSTAQSLPNPPEVVEGRPIAIWV